MTTLPFINPATGEQFGQMRASTPAEVTRAVADLRHNLPTWRAKTPAERGYALRKFKEHLIDRADEITAVLNQDCGKTRQDGLTEVFITVDNLHNMIQHAPRWLRRKSIPRGLYVFKHYHTEYVPYGVVGVIGPWNYPLVQVMTPVLGALAAGNTVIIKPSEVTPAVGLLLEQLFAAVPDLAPYVRVVHGGAEIGQAVVQAPPDLIFVTGSERTGQAIHKAAAETLTPVLTELGGKDPLIVLDDADVEAAAKWSVWASFYHSGQVCMSVERVYVVESVYEQFVEAVKRETAAFRIGYTTDIHTDYNCGPITFPRQVEIIASHIEDAQQKGATLLAGGGRGDMFYQPTVLTNVTHDMLVMREETFGPVLPIMKVRNEEEAIQKANDCAYGLCAYVWSRNLARAERVGRQLEAGTVVVNDAMAHYAVSQLPFGGVKKSGTGRIHGPEEVLQFAQLKGYAIGQAPHPMDIATYLRAPNRYREMKALLKLVFGNWRQRGEIAQDWRDLTPSAQTETAEQTPHTVPVGRVLAGVGVAAAVVFAVAKVVRGQSA